MSGKEKENGDHFQLFDTIRVRGFVCFFFLVLPRYMNEISSLFCVIQQETIEKCSESSKIFSTVKQIMDVGYQAFFSFFQSNERPFKSKAKTQNGHAARSTRRTPGSCGKILNKRWRGKREKQKKVNY